MKQHTHEPEASNPEQEAAMPSTSVIIPCFNTGNYLIESVASALNQKGKFALLEVIVIDDRSDDANTLSALSTVSGMAGVTVLHNNGPKGSAAARNVGIREANGDWIAFLDADDWWPLDSLTKRFSALTNYPDASWIGGDFIELNRDGTTEQSGRFQRNLDTYYFLKEAYSCNTPVRLDTPLHHFLTQAPTNTIVTLIKRNLLLRIAGYNECHLRQQDYDLFLRLAAASSFVFIPSVVAYYRLHGSNSTKSLTHTQGWRIRVLQDLAKRPEFYSERNAILQRICHLHLSNSYEYRREKKYRSAVCASLRCLIRRKYVSAALKSLAAALLHR